MVIVVRALTSGPSQTENKATGQMAVLQHQEEAVVGSSPNEDNVAGLHRSRDGMLRPGNVHFALRRAM
jgi:hypothetical protein